MPVHAGLAAEKGFFAGIRAALDELHDADLQAVAEGAGDDAEGGARLPCRCRY